jgi:hypothetical protein
MRAVNLIPAEARRGAALGAGRSDGAVYGVMAVLGGLAVLALIYGIAQHQISSRRSQLASTAERTQRAQAEVAQLTPYTSFIALREQRVQAVSQLVDSRFDWAHAFHELGRVLPHDASISSLTGQIGSTTTGASASSSSTPSTPSTSGTGSASATASAATVSSATPPGSVPTFALTGCATSQAQVALTLERLRLIDGVSEVTLQSSTKAGSQSGGSSGASSAGCPSDSPAFSVAVSFDPIPTAPATSASSAKLTSSTGVEG